MADETLAPTATRAEIEAYIRKNYPDAAPYLGNQEIADLLFKLAPQNADATEVTNALHNTNYWKTHGEASRQFDLLLANGSPDAAKKIADAQILVDQAFQKEGIKLGAEQLGQYAKDYIRGGWTPTDLNRFVAGQLPKASLPGGGQAAATADVLFARAHDYLVPVTRQQAADWAVKIKAGNATDQGWTDYLVTLARSKFGNEPDVLKRMDEGLTPSQYFDPLKNQMAGIFEVDPNTIDLNDPKYQTVTSTFDPNIKGARVQTLAENAQWARDQVKAMPNSQRPTWWHQRDATVGLQLARALGALPQGGVN